MFAFIPVKFKYLKTLAKTFIIPGRKNQLYQKYISNSALVDEIAIQVKRNSAFTRTFTKNPF